MRVSLCSCRYLQALRGTLRELRLAGTAVTNTGVKSATSLLQSLEILDVYRCTALTDAAFGHMPVCCRRLRSLDARGTRVTSELLSLFQATDISQIDLRDCRGVGNSDTIAISSLPRTRVLLSV